MDTTAIKNYIHSLFVKEEPHIRYARENSQMQGLPQIHVASHVGQLIYLLAKSHEPRTILEIGTLGGYSTIWLAKALSKDGTIISLELEPHHAKLAREHIARAGYHKSVEIRLGKAQDLLSAMIKRGEGPFDLIFIDADKENYPTYLEQALALSAPGTLILSDNLLPKGEEIDNPKTTNVSANAIYQFNRQIAHHPRLESMLIPIIVGEQGRIDALGFSLVK